MPESVSSSSARPVIERTDQTRKEVRSCSTRPHRFVAHLRAIRGCYADATIIPDGNDSLCDICLTSRQRRTPCPLLPPRVDTNYSALTLCKHLGHCSPSKSRSVGREPSTPGSRTPISTSPFAR